MGSCDPSDDIKTMPGATVAAEAATILRKVYLRMDLLGVLIFAGFYKEALARFCAMGCHAGRARNL